MPGSGAAGGCPVDCGAPINCPSIRLQKLSSDQWIPETPSWLCSSPVSTVPPRAPKSTVSASPSISAGSGSSHIWSDTPSHESTPLTPLSTPITTMLSPIRATRRAQNAWAWSSYRPVKSSCQTAPSGTASSCSVLLSPTRAQKLPSVQRIPAAPSCVPACPVSTLAPLGRKSA